VPIAPGTFSTNPIWLRNASQTLPGRTECIRMRPGKGTGLFLAIERLTNAPYDEERQEEGRPELPAVGDQDSRQGGHRQHGTHPQGQRFIVPSQMLSPLGTGRSVVRSSRVSAALLACMSDGPSVASYCAGEGDSNLGRGMMRAEGIAHVLESSVQLGVRRSTTGCWSPAPSSANRSQSA